MYAKEMSDADHERLIGALSEVNGTVILSGYDSPLYSKLLAGWRRDSKETLDNSLQKRTEIIWIKP